MIPTLEQIQAAAPRFWKKARQAGRCLLWEASADSHGYGQIRIGGRKASPIGAHKVAYILAHGPIPEGMEVCHNCPDGDNPRCVNPDHLFLATHAENIRDAAAKGRLPQGERHQWFGRGKVGEESNGAKLVAGDVRAIRLRYNQGDATPTQLAREYDVAVSTIWHILRRETWKHIPWEVA